MIRSLKNFFFAFSCCKPNQEDGEPQEQKKKLNYFPSTDNIPNRTYMKSGAIYYKTTKDVDDKKRPGAMTTSSVVTGRGKKPTETDAIKDIPFSESIIKEESVSSN